jgi:hypothetical protein
MHRLMQNASGQWVESDTHGLTATSSPTTSSRQPHYFTYMRVPIVANTPALWGADPESNEVSKWLLSPAAATVINKGLTDSDSRLVIIVIFNALENEK